MRLEMFENSPTGHLTPIHGTDPRHGPWSHAAFVPDPLPRAPVHLSPLTYTAVSDARGALAALDARASLLPNPALLRRPTLRIEAQSTSALEGTYAPLEDVLGTDDDDEPQDTALREVLNYVRVAEEAFAATAEGRPIGVALLTNLQQRLVRGTHADNGHAGAVRDIPVMIGAGHDTPVHQARFIPPPPGLELETALRDAMDWFNRAPSADVDPVVAAGLFHYQFESLHPFNDGNGRLGRLLIVLHLQHHAVLREPTLTVSPWFESRRREYYERLLAVSTDGDWDAWIGFFARGLAASARDTEQKLSDLVAVQRDLKVRARDAGLRADSAMQLIDFAVARTYFTVRQVERALGLSYGRSNGLVAQLVDARVLQMREGGPYNRRFFAPEVVRALATTR